VSYNVDIFLSRFHYNTFPFARLIIFYDLHMARGILWEHMHGRDSPMLCYNNNIGGRICHTYTKNIY